MVYPFFLVNILKKEVVTSVQQCKVYKRMLFTLLVINVLVLGVKLVQTYGDQLPDDIKVMVGRDSKFDFDVPAIATVANHDSTLNLKNPITISSKETGSYLFNVKLWGILTLKNVKVDVIKPERVIPGGDQVGIYIETQGVLVLDTQVIPCEDGLNHEPAKNILKAGDYIQKINDIRIHSKEELIQIVKKQGENPLVIEILRGKKLLQVKLNPVKSKEDSQFKLGVWVRDNTQGIGTLTYYTDHSFGALGHGIHDVDTGEMMDVDSGYLFDSKILSLVKGKDGTPGEVVGSVIYDYDNPIGVIQKNTKFGIYGALKSDKKIETKKESVEIGLKQDVKEGKAYIRSCISGTSIDYEIDIINIDITNKNVAKGMVIKITDERLLKLTNGIIQGMSGTPILQDNKLIGAVTHVFVQDSTKGYATFIENMLRESNEI